MKLDQISTPALVVDNNILRKNSEEMSSLLKDSNLKLRPHYKSHKCSAIAHMQMEAGAVGITCAKLDEAIDLADSGITNILIANQIVEDSKISKLAHLAKLCRLTVCVDNEKNIADIERAAALIDATVHCLIEYEIGMERCGVATKENVAELAEFIDKCPHLTFDGIQAYAGHLSHTVSFGERAERTRENTEKIKELLNYLASKDIKVDVLSGGSTGTSQIKAREGLYTELQAGSYLFMDATYNDLALPFKPSLFILTTVVSVNDKLAVVDAGVKSCGIDQGMPVPYGFSVSHIVASEEHLQLHNPSKKLKVGDKILLIPAHCCSTVNLHDRIYLFEDDEVVDRLLITARGCFH